LSEAANLTTVSDTLSDSDLGVSSDHTVVFTTPTGVANGETFILSFPGQFNLSTSTAILDLEDFDVASTSDYTLVYTCAGTGIAVATSTPTSQDITFTICSASDALAVNATATIQIGTNAGTGGTGDSQIINPEAAGSYEITIGGTQTDSGAMRIAIIDDVLVTASVATTFSFVINGLPAGVTVNGSPTTTADATTATTLPFGTLAANVSKTLAQNLRVTTNAANGFTVTLNQNQNLTSSSGADIDRFQNDTPPGSPTAWTPPTGSLGSENTYGHMGITTEDSNLAGGDDFGSDLWAGDFVANAREVFYHTGPADGVTADQGSTTVGFQAEIMTYQEAGSDYTASITYVATPVF